MNERSQQLLSIIAEHYIENAQPVGSKMLVEERGLTFSPATVRNEMKILEDEGYLTHPHTSAGRILTEKGWKFYVEHLPKDPKLSEQQETDLTRVLHNASNTTDQVKALARYLAEQMDEAVFVSFRHNDTYYTGLSNLFRKPEFATQTMVVDLSEVVDHFDDVLSRLASAMGDDDIKTLIGRDNPFSPTCSAIVGKMSNERFIGIVGPMRMNYHINIPYLYKTIELLTS